MCVQVTCKLWHYNCLNFWTIKPSFCILNMNCIQVLNGSRSSFQCIFRFCVKLCTVNNWSLTPAWPDASSHSKYNTIIIVTTFFKIVLVVTGSKPFLSDFLSQSLKSSVHGKMQYVINEIKFQTLWHLGFSVKMLTDSMIRKLVLDNSKYQALHNLFVILWEICGCCRSFASQYKWVKNSENTRKCFTLSCAAAKYCQNPSPSPKSKSKVKSLRTWG